MASHLCRMFVHNVSLLFCRFNVAESSGDRAILPVFDPARSSGGESQVAIKGGRVRFYTWASHIKDLLAECVLQFDFNAQN